MSIIHAEPFEGAGKTYKRINGQTYRVEDWWDRLAGMSWTISPVAAAFAYALRVHQENLSWNDEVVYGKDELGLGHIVHVSELAEVVS